MPDSLRAENAYFRILDTAPDAMIVVGPDSKIVFVNVQTERLFGYPRAELLDKSLEVLVPERFRGAHGGHVSKYFANPGARPMGSGLELFGARKDGSELAIEVSLSPVDMGQATLVSAAIRDISQRKALEAASKLAADRLKSAVESIQDAFALFDSDDNVVSCNSAYRNLLAAAVQGTLIGRPFSDILDRWLVDLAFPNEAARHAFRAERVAQRAQGTATYEVRTHDGRTLCVTDRKTAEGGIVTTIWDLTDDVRHAEELRSARVLAEAGSEAKSEFLSSMSHELRTPLNAILGFAQLLQRDKKEPLSERHRARVEQILKGGEHLLRLIDDILDLSRIEAGGVSISTEPIDAVEVVREVITTLGPVAQRADVKVELDPPSVNVPMVAADRTRFAQILMNLGSNAIKYNKKGGKVRFTLSAANSDHLRAEVVDDGFGIPLDKQDKVFQPFHRAGQETGPIEGTGIGLAITKRLAELMRGAVGFESKPDVGSKFWVDLPIYQSTPSQKPVAVRHLPKDGVEPHGRVLYVEDNPANVTFMRDLLDGFEGILLVTAPSAEIGVELALSERPALVIMDINLPGMSGLDALAELKRHPETRDIPVIALTAAASPRDRQRGEQAGFHRYLTKPIKVDELEAVLQEILGN